MQKFKSKIDLWFTILVGILFTLILIRLAYDQNWVGFIFILIVVSYVVYSFLTTFYVIEGDKLKIKCGYFFNFLIEIKDVQKVSETFNIISSPALSFNRLEILYNKFNTLLISPKDKNRFLKELKRVNPDIKIVLKK
ncbi:PH domain-containing protein [Flavobacterium sp. ACN6]|uniref:PH domain-containing protein n=1 Tax=Flavobacterium sp. ACN6 TaxID=1920426 RepID=UPI000BB3837C|nr:PH domain-containing protein [Flavobacterium sp. ACN6]PBJ12148.1 hypothetical protein BSF42_21030 [Flavobacterium sp. ACN6]